MNVNINKHYAIKMHPLNRLFGPITIINCPADIDTSIQLKDAGITFNITQPVEKCNTLKSHIIALQEGMKNIGGTYILIVENGVILETNGDEISFDDKFDIIELGITHERDPHFVFASTVTTKPKKEIKSIRKHSGFAYAVHRSFIPTLITFYKKCLLLPKTKTVDETLELILFIFQARILITNPAIFSYCC